MVVKQFRASTPVDNLPRITINGDTEKEIADCLLSLCITYAKQGEPSMRYGMWKFHTDGVNYGKACELLLKAGYVGIHVG